MTLEIIPSNVISGASRNVLWRQRGREPISVDPEFRSDQMPSAWTECEAINSKRADQPPEVV
jgi:hypothetical protein